MAVWYHLSGTLFDVSLSFLGKSQGPLYGGFRVCPQSHGDPSLQSDAPVHSPLLLPSIDIILQNSITSKATKPMSSLPIGFFVFLFWSEGAPYLQDKIINKLQKCKSPCSVLWLNLNYFIVVPVITKIYLIRSYLWFFSSNICVFLPSPIIH